MEENLRDIENEILASSLMVVHASVDFADISNDDEAPPQSWVDKYGLAQSLKRFRIAKAAWKNAKEAPVGIKVATQIASSIIKSRSMERVAPRQLSVTWVNVAKSSNTKDMLSEYPEIIDTVSE